MIYPDGKEKVKEVYEGSFKNGELIDDNGTITCYYGEESTLDTQVFEGQIQNGLLNGSGKVTFTSKSGNLKTVIMESDHWEKNFLQGNGKQTLYYTNGNIGVYDGDFKDSQWNGSGTLTYTYADGSYDYQEGTAVEGNFNPSLTIKYDKNGNELSREES